MQRLREKFKKSITYIPFVHTKANMEPISTIVLAFDKQVILKLIIYIVFAYPRYVLATSSLQATGSIIISYGSKAAQSDFGLLSEDLF